MRMFAFSLLVAAASAALAQEIDPTELYVPYGWVGAQSQGVATVEMDGISFTFTVGSDGSWSEEFNTFRSKYSKNPAMLTAIEALQSALEAKVQIYNLAETMANVIGGNGFYAEYTDVEGNAHSAKVSYYDKTLGIGTAPTEANPKTLKTGKAIADDVTLQRSADGVFSIKNWESGATAGTVDLSEYLSGNSTLVDQSAYSTYELPARKPDGTLAYIPIGDKLDIGGLQVDGESVTTNEVEGNKLSIVGFEAAKGNSGGDSGMLFPYVNGGGLQWANLTDFLDLKSLANNDDREIEVYGFSTSEPGAFAVAGDEHIEWKTIEDMFDENIFTKNTDEKITLVGVDTPMQPSVRFGTDENGQFGFWPNEKVEIKVDGVTITTNEASGGKLSIKGFTEAAKGTDFKLPFAHNSAFSWQTLGDFFDELTFEPSYDGKMDLVGFDSADEMQIPYKGDGGLAWADIGELANDDLFSTLDGELILTGWSSNVAENKYFGTDADGKVGFNDFPGGLQVDGESITTNESAGATEQGVASIMYWTTAKSAASANDPYIPYTMGRTLGWHGLGSFVDDETIVKDSNSGTIKLKGWTSGMGSRHYYGTDENGQGPGFYELPNITTNFVEVDEETITSNTDEQGNIKDISIKGFAEAKNKGANEPMLPFYSGEFAWKEFSSFMDGSLFAKKANAQETTLKGAENGIPSSRRYYGTDAGGTVGFHELPRLPSYDGVSVDTNGNGGTVEIKGWASQDACSQTLRNLMKSTDETTRNGHEIVCRVGSGASAVIHYLKIGDVFAMPDTTDFTTDEDEGTFHIAAPNETGKIMTANGDGRVAWSDYYEAQLADQEGDRYTINFTEHLGGEDAQKSVTLPRIKVEESESGRVLQWMDVDGESLQSCDLGDARMDETVFEKNEDGKYTIKGLEEARTSGKPEFFGVNKDGTPGMHTLAAEDGKSIGKDSEGNFELNGFSSASEANGIPIASKENGELVWKTIGDFADPAIFGIETSEKKLTLKGAESQKPPEKMYFGTPTDGTTIGFHKRFPEVDGAFVATKDGWKELQEKAVAVHPPDEKSIDFDFTSANTNLQIKGWKDAKACGESVYDLITTPNEGSDPEHWLVAKVGEELHYLPFGTDKLNPPDEETITAVVKDGDAIEKKFLTVKPGGDKLKFLRTVEGADGKMKAAWSDLPLVRDEDVDEPEYNCISITPDTDSGEIKLAAVPKILATGTEGSADGHKFRFESKDDSNVKVEVSKSGTEVVLKIGVYYK